jgi:hypothetical protein
MTPDSMQTRTAHLEEQSLSDCESQASAAVKLWRAESYPQAKSQLGLFLTDVGSHNGVQMVEATGLPLFAPVGSIAATRLPPRLPLFVEPVRTTPIPGSLQEVQRQRDAKLDVVKCKHLSPVRHALPGMPLIP